MRRPGRRSIILVSCIIVAAITAFIFWPGEREPEYQGKTLSEWLLLSEKNRLGIRPNVIGTGNANANINTEDAIRHFGTNALPYLIKAVQKKRTVPRSLLRQLAYKLRLPPRLLTGLRRPALESLLRESATVHAFETLGPVAVPAVPELARIMYRSQDQEISHRAMNCLAAIRPEGLFILGTALTNPVATATFKDNAIDAISVIDLETNASFLLPMVLAWLKETNAANVRVAVKALGEMTLRPDVSVPALTDKLGDPAVRLDVIEALENFDKDAAPAIPHLIRLLTDANSAVAVAAAEALGEIGEQPDTVVPALAKTLTEHTNNLPLGIAAADALGRYGAKAQSAIPALKIAVADPRRALSLPAQIALTSITAQLSQTNGAGAEAEAGAPPR